MSEGPKCTPLGVFYDNAPNATQKGHDAGKLLVSIMRFWSFSNIQLKIIERNCGTKSMLEVNLFDCRHKKTTYCRAYFDVGY